MRLADALAMAVQAHQGQSRKGTHIPYISHPMAVAALVIERGGTEDQAIAGLLHDAIEDGGVAYAERIRKAFGSHVLELVEACSDGTAEGKATAETPEAKRADWKRRKDTYLARLRTENDEVLLVSACDKLHNARSIVADLQAIGPVVFERFTAGREGTLWYYSEIALILRERGSSIASEVSVAVNEMMRHATEAAEAVSQ
jgi:(p)ppGpp synthase/HD superfamily hydrolase